MVTEDDRYRQSSQFRLWSFSPPGLHDLRRKSNALARDLIAPRLPGVSDFLTLEEEAQLVNFFTVELIRAAQFCELPTEIRSTAAIFLRRFYVTNSVMTYPPTELLKTSLFFGCKAEGFYMRLGKLAEKFPNTTGEQILAGEFLLCQGIRFAFDVRHPFRALEGAVLELRRQCQAAAEGEKEQGRINKAHARAREILKFSPLVTDAYFHFTPSQIMLAALLMADAGLVAMLLPKPTFNGKEVVKEEEEEEGKKKRQEGEDTSVVTRTDEHGKIMATIEQCRDMLAREPPERMTDYWSQPEAVKSMKPLRKKLQKCRDPDRANLVALQQARREQASARPKQGDKGNDGAVFGHPDGLGPKRRKIDGGGGGGGDFGPPL